MDVEAVIGLNATLSWRSRRLVSSVLRIYLFGPVGGLLIRLFFRVRSDLPSLRPSMARPGGGTPYGPRAILAIQHYFEWDAPIPYLMAFWPYALLRPSFLPLHTGGDFWSRNPLMRTLSWVAGILCFVPGREPEQGAMRTLATLLERRERLTAIIYPTGPSGRRRRYLIQRGIGWLAIERPEVPIVPIALGGVKEARLVDVLLLRRPTLRLREGKPFLGRDILGATREEREDAVRAEIARQWKELSPHEP